MVLQFAQWFCFPPFLINFAALVWEAESRATNIKLPTSKIPNISFSFVRTCCFSVFQVHSSLCFGLSAGQNKLYEDVTLWFGKQHFSTFSDFSLAKQLIKKIISRLTYRETHLVCLFGWVPGSCGSNTDWLNTLKLGNHCWRTICGCDENWHVVITRNDGQRVRGVELNAWELTNNVIFMLSL